MDLVGTRIVRNKGLLFIKQSIYGIFVSTAWIYKDSKNSTAFTLFYLQRFQGMKVTLEVIVFFDELRTADSQFHEYL
jgi:hypothetical protein